VIFSTGLSEQDFHPKQLKAALRKTSVSPVEESRLPRKAQ
jgi:lambda repressor-like predicted transcriptional regulator